MSARVCENPACLDTPKRRAAKFCSLSCAAVVRHAAGRGPAPSKTCPCGETFTRDMKQTVAEWGRRKFCSRTCLGRPRTAAERREAERQRSAKRRAAKRGDTERQLAPGQSVFGDPKPVQPWRPAAWREAS